MKIETPSTMPAEERAEWERWYEERPQIIRDMIDQTPPWCWYKLTIDHDPEESRYQIHAYAEDGTVSVHRTSVATCAPMWSVFGIRPADLEPADSPEEAHLKIPPARRELMAVRHERKVAELRQLVEARRAEGWTPADGCLHCDAEEVRGE